MTVTIKNLSDNAPDPNAAREIATDFLAARTTKRLKKAVSETLEQFEAHLLPGAKERALQALYDFPSIYENRLVRDNGGGSGFNDSLWLFIMARAIMPQSVIESGVHKGHSTWIFRQACPEARIFSFDITFENRIYHDENAHYFEHDWSDWSCPEDLNPDKTLVFFDDHISHAKRLIQAAHRSFSTVLLDDNFAAEHLYATGGPPLPTLEMIFDDRLLEIDEISWHRNAKSYSYPIEKEDILEARKLIEGAWILPELAEITRHALGSRLSFAKIGTRALSHL